MQPPPSQTGQTGTTGTTGTTVPAPSATAAVLAGRSLPEGFARRSACPLCDGPAEGCGVHMDFPEIPVLRCGACGFIHPAWTFTPEGMERYYREVFASPWHRKGQELNSYVNMAALRRLTDLSGVRSFLDVGTGYGFLLRRLKESLGIEGVGAEPSVQEAQWGVQNLGVRIVNALARDSGLPEASFDVVACFEVIEHAPDPRAFVRDLARFCKPGGLVIINTDNFECAAVKALGPRFAKWIPHSHVSDFAPATLVRAVETAGAEGGLKVESRLSYTAWENALRAGVAGFQQARSPAECFSLRAELGREMKRTYRLWPLRLALARAWFALTWRRDLEGSLMYVAARKG